MKGLSLRQCPRVTQSCVPVSRFKGAIHTNRSLFDPDCDSRARPHYGGTAETLCTWSTRAMSSEGTVLGWASSRSSKHIKFPYSMYSTFNHTV